MVTPNLTREHLSGMPESVSVASVVDALADRQRREILVTLARGDPPEHVRTLARTLAGSGDLTDDEGSRLLIRLHHAHLPKLAKTSLVSYGDETNTVTLTEFGRQVAGAL